MVFFDNLETPRSYLLVDTIKKLSQVVDLLVNEKEIAFDIETTHATLANKDKKFLYNNSYPATVAGVSFSWGDHGKRDPWVPGDCCYIPLVKSDLSPFWKNNQDRVIESLDTILSSDSGKIGHNGKFDVYWLFKCLGIKVNNFTFDTMLAKILLDEDKRICYNSLKSNFDSYGKISKLGCSDAFLGLGNSVWKSSLDSALDHYDPEYRRYSKIPLDVLYPYACADTDLTFSLKEVFKPMLEEEGMLWLFDEVVMPFTMVLTRMQLKGAPVDLNKVNYYIEELGKKCEELEPLVKEQLGVTQDFNIASGSQLGKLLFDDWKLPGGVKNKTGWVVDADVLEEIDHPALKELVRWKKLQKVLSTYLVGLKKHVTDLGDNGIGWVHPDIMQDAVTGRVTTKDPNLTNQPKPNPEEEEETGEPSLGRIVRSCFRCESGYKFIFADYAQQELKMIAHITNEPVWIDGFNNNLDMHSVMASKIWKLNYEDVKKKHPDKRKKAKTVNFGIAYGTTEFGLSRNLGVPVEDAIQLIGDYYIAAPVLAKCIEDTHEFLLSNGYVTTLFGRRRHLPDALLTGPGFKVRWPDERPECYRNTFWKGYLGVSDDDLRRITPEGLQSLAKGRNLMEFNKCKTCKDLFSCFMSTWSRETTSKINRAKRQSFNVIIQGSCADMTALAMRWIDKEFLDRGMKSRMCFYIHDEVGSYVPEEEVETVISILKDCMEARMQEFLQFRVPLTIDVEVKDGWSSC